MPGSESNQVVSADKTVIFRVALKPDTSASTPTPRGYSAARLSTRMRLTSPLTESSVSMAAMA